MLLSYNRVMFNLREIRWKVTPNIEITLDPDRSLLVPLHRFNQVRVPVESNPTAIAFDGSHIWVANDLGSSVTVLNAGDGSWVQTLSGGSYGFDYPFGVAFDGSHIWVTNGVGNSVTELPAG